MIARAFSLFDAMVLIAATAIGVRVIGLWWRLEHIPGFHTSFRNIADLLRFFACTLAFYWGIALVFLRLRRPRPPLRLLGRQPGFVACYAAVFAYLAQVSFGGYALLIRTRRDRWEMIENMLIGLTGVQYIAPVVTLAWLVLLVGRSWEPEAGWLDRLGRMIGALWIVMYAELLMEIYGRAIFT